MSEKEKVIINAIMRSLTDAQKEHIYGLLVSHNKAVKSCCDGEFLTIPSIEVRFIQAAYVDLHEQSQPGTRTHQKA